MCDHALLKAQVCVCEILGLNPLYCTVNDILEFAQSRLEVSLSGSATKLCMTMLFEQQRQMDSFLTGMHEVDKTFPKGVKSSHRIVAPLWEWSNKPMQDTDIHYMAKSM